MFNVREIFTIDIQKHIVKIKESNRGCSGKRYFGNKAKNTKLYFSESYMHDEFVGEIVI